jgi:hypothetical protein
MSTYRIREGLDGPVLVKIEEDRLLTIPEGPANTDYAEYLAWVEAGNTPEPWQPDSES